MSASGGGSMAAEARALLAACLAGAMLVAPGTRATSQPPLAPAASRGFPYVLERTRVLDVNRLALHVSNAGPFALDPARFEAGLEYPRGSRLPLAFAAGPWLIGIAGAETLSAISEFAWEFVPGPSTAGRATFDTLHHVVYRTARADTAGRGQWLERGEQVGAPLDPSTREPVLRGDLHLWTVFTDAPTQPPQSPSPRFGTTAPIGVDVALSVYAFDRPGFASEAAFLEYTLVHRGAATLDSTWFGIWLDALGSHGSPPLTAYDEALELAIAYRQRDDDALYGASGPALGLLWLRGPSAGAGGPLAPGSFVVWANAGDPQNLRETLGAMRGLRPQLGPMIDPTTQQPSPYWAPGDPVTGAGWVDTVITHPHLVLAAGPFRFAPGDTQRVAVALLVGRGPSRLESVTRLRSQAAEATAAWAEDFASLPPWTPPTPPPARGRAWPNPASGTVSIGWRAVPGTPLTVEVFDPRGRRVRHLRTVATQGPDGSTPWDLHDDAGRRVRPGLYLARVSGPGIEHAARLVVLE